MTGLCLDCNQPAHVGLSCSGFPLMLLDEPEPECHCGAPMNESDIACTACRREAAAYVPMVMAGLDELYWRRVNAEVLAGAPEARTVAIDLSRDPEHDEWCDAGCEARGHVYEYVSTVGTLAALGLALGSLAPLVRMLGGVA